MPPTADTLTLVVLAAGMGSRYGGLKQLDAVGPGGATLMDYSVFDAARAGFTDAVFVVRPDMEEAFRSQAASRYGRRLRVATVTQRLDDVPPGQGVPAGRAKPWGTGQAVLAAAPVLAGPFAVVNADDFYGAPAYGAVAAHLRHHGAAGPWAVVGYRLADTASASGGVNRAVIRAAGERLTDLEEVVDLVAGPDGYAGRGRSGPVVVPGEALVSMNMWGFTPSLLAVLREGFAGFLATADRDAGEYLLPTAVQDAVRAGRGEVRVLDARSPWFGMTWTADRPAVAAALRALVDAGHYPEDLR